MFEGVLRCEAMGMGWVSAAGLLGMDYMVPSGRGVCTWRVLLGEDFRFSGVGLCFVWLMALVS